MVDLKGFGSACSLVGDLTGVKMMSSEIVCPQHCISLTVIQGQVPTGFHCSTHQWGVATLWFFVIDCDLVDKRESL